jgi:hypothetical protein
MDMEFLSYVLHTVSTYWRRRVLLQQRGADLKSPHRCLTLYLGYPAGTLVHYVLSSLLTLTFLTPLESPRPECRIQ